MLSIDTNIFLHAFNQDSPHHKKAYAWLVSQEANDDIAISEFVMAEFYCLLRNPAVVAQPLAPSEAVEVVQMYRNHPRWKLLGFTPESRSLHDQLWRLARSPQFAFRRLYDARTALTMIAQGVTEFATTNEKDFAGLGFKKVWNPLAKQH